MKKYFFFLCIPLLFIQIAVAQAPDPSWIRYFDGHGDEDHVVSITNDENENIYVSGWLRRTSSETDYLTIKYNSNGQRLQSDTVDPGTSDKVRSSAYRAGYLAVSGASKVGSYYHIATVRYDTTDLSRSWAKTYSSGSQNDEAVAVKIGSNDGIYIVGNYKYTSADPDVIVLKYSADGNTITSSNITSGNGKDDLVYDMVLDASDNVYVLGLTSNGVGVKPTWFVKKFDDALSLQWTTTYSGDWQAPVDIDVDTSGHVYVLGGFGSSIIIVYQASNGSALDTLVDSNLFYPSALTVRPSDTTIYVSGRYNTSPNARVVLGKYQYSGSSLSQSWKVTYGSGSYNWIGNKVFVDTAGHVYVGGMSHYTDGDSSDVILLKYNSSGTLQWDQSYDGVFSGSQDSLTAMTASSLGNIFLGMDSHSSLFVGNPERKDVEVIKYNVGGSFTAQARYSENLDFANKTITNEYNLSQNYPNPFNPTTRIMFTVPEASTITLNIYDIAGKEVKSLVNDEYYEKGSYEIVLNAEDLSSGVYYYRIMSSDTKFQLAKKMLLIK